MRTTLLAGLLVIAVSGYGMDGPAPQASKETPAAGSPQVAAPRPASNVMDKNAAPEAAPQALANARRGVTTKLVKREADHKAPSVPPAGVMQLVQYESPIGNLKAYVTPAPTDGKKHPAIVWITGGDCNAIDECWTGGPPNNEPTAAAFRGSSIVTMFPSLRGGNDSPGYKEGMFGEVQQILLDTGEGCKIELTEESLQRAYTGGR